MLDEDRRRIASEIHDGPVQDLTVARLRIDLLRQRLQGDAALEDLDGVEETIALASDRLREIVAGLHDAAR
jgi:two-component system, NarL family, sensor histidine kinase DegS